MATLFLGMPSAAAAFVGGGVSRTVQPLQRASVMTIAAENVAGDPAGTFSPRKSKVLRANAQDGPWVDQRARPRRNRKSENVRKMVRETIVTPSNFIYPLFIHDESANVGIPSMPGCERHSLDSMVAEAKDAWQYGVRSFVIFPKVPDKLKTNRGEEAYNPDGIVPRLALALALALALTLTLTRWAAPPSAANAAASTQPTHATPSGRATRGSSATRSPSAGRSTPVTGTPSNPNPNPTLTLDAEHLIDLELDREAVAVPAEAALDVVAGLVRVPADDVLRPAARARQPRTIGLRWRWRVGAVRGSP